MPMPMRKQPPYTGFASRDAVAKLRLDGTPTPRSRVARMTKRPTPTGDGKSASPGGGPNEGRARTDTTKPNGDRARPCDREAAKNPREPAMGPPEGTASSGSTS